MTPRGGLPTIVYQPTIPIHHRSDSYPSLNLSSSPYSHLWLVVSVGPAWSVYQLSLRAFFFRNTYWMMHASTFPFVLFVCEKKIPRYPHLALSFSIFHSSEGKTTFNALTVCLRFFIAGLDMSLLVVWCTCGLRRDVDHLVSVRWRVSIWEVVGPVGRLIVCVL